MARNKIARTIAALGAFADGFVKGQRLGIEMDKAGREREMLDELKQVDTNFTPSETQTASGEEALQAAQQAKQNALQGAVSEEDIARVDANYQPTIAALEARQTTPAGVVSSLGIGRDFQQRAVPFTENEIANSKALARSGIYSRAGREDDASRVMLNEQRRRQLADDTELRRVMDPGAPTGTPGGRVLDLADVTASDGIPGPTKIIRAQGVDEPGQVEKDGQASKAYYERKAPVIIDTLLKQGKLDEAKRYRDFIDSEQGRAYAEKWSRGVRKFAIGDHQGALKDWQDLYNSQLYNDGRTVKLSDLGDGNTKIEQFGADGKFIGAKNYPIDALARQAGMALAPEALVKMRAAQEERRQQEEAGLDKAITLETMRQQGQEAREDRRDARLVKQIDAANSRAASRGGLTAAQERGNAEIEAAREAVSGLSAEDIRIRTSPTTATGRENPQFDPQLARNAKLASRRKIGNDDWFDSRSGRQPAESKPAGTPKERAQAAMAADPSMAGMTLGTFDGRRFKVLDADGKHVGYYGSER